MDDSTLKVGSNEKSEVSIGEGGLKPIDIPVPIFPKVSLLYIFCVICFSVS